MQNRLAESKTYTYEPCGARKASGPQSWQPQPRDRRKKQKRTTIFGRAITQDVDSYRAALNQTYQTLGTSSRQIDMVSLEL